VVLPALVIVKLFAELSMNILLVALLTLVVLITTDLFHDVSEATVSDVSLIPRVTDGVSPPILFNVNIKVSKPSVKKSFAILRTSDALPF
jgi:hypothetical protein